MVEIKSLRVQCGRGLAAERQPQWAVLPLARGGVCWLCMGSPPADSAKMPSFPKPALLASVIVTFAPARISRHIVGDMIPLGLSGPWTGTHWAY